MDYGKFVRRGIIVAKLIKESVAFASGQLRGDKLRTFLSLFGVTIGIFSIVAIFTAIDALKESTRRGFEVLGGDVVLVSTFPFTAEEEEGADVSGGGGEYKWWEYMRRPALTDDDFEFLKEHSKLTEHFARMVQFRRTVKYGRTSVDDCFLCAVTYEWNAVSPFDLDEGRYFTNEECNRGLPVAILGCDIARELFNGISPIDKTIKVGGFPVRIIGVVEKQGSSIVNIIGYDNMVLLPVEYAGRLVNTRNADIFAKPYPDVNGEDFTDELKQLLRNSRRLSPQDKNNFSVNEMTFITSIVDKVFASLTTAGWIIAGFSLLIGGFGIANIMFVSVKERTHIIGIQKALGAKRYFILSQFLAEAIFLSVAGGGAGIFLVFALVLLTPESEIVTISLSIYNILSGLLIAAAIGVISGIIPAIKGASLDPVDAINSK